MEALGGWDLNRCGLVGAHGSSWVGFRSPWVGSDCHGWGSNRHWWVQIAWVAMGGFRSLSVAMGPLVLVGGHGFALRGLPRVLGLVVVTKNRSNLVFLLLLLFVFVGMDLTMVAIDGGGGGVGCDCDCGGGGGGGG